VDHGADEDERAGDAAPALQRRRRHDSSAQTKVATCGCTCDSCVWDTATWTCSRQPVAASACPRTTTQEDK
jgi:hypothetical protein